MYLSKLQKKYSDINIAYTRRGTNAKAHWMSHMDVKGYTCEKCAASFTRRVNLNGHLLKCGVDDAQIDS